MHPRAHHRGGSNRVANINTNVSLGSEHCRRAPLVLEHVQNLALDLKT